MSMMLKKRWGFGLGTIFSLIIVYFIHLYSKERGWALLAFISKWYLIIIGILIALPLLIIILILLFSLLMFLIAAVKMKKFNKAYKKHRKQNTKDYVDAVYKVKE